MPDTLTEEASSAEMPESSFPKLIIFIHTGG